MTTVLMIDDDPDVTATVREYFAVQAPETVFVAEPDFANALIRVREVRPDVLILDVYRGTPTTGHVAAQPVWTDIWGNWFCPLVFYSAGDIDVEPAPPDDHPFIRKIQKGANTERQVLAEINGFQPHVSALQSVSQELGKVTHSVLRDVAKHVFDVERDEGKRTEMVVRLARRRVAAKMDDALTASGDPLHPWEQYIYPPLVAHLVVGDVLRTDGADWKDTSAYRVVVTPTCDMVPYGAPPKCKVESVLAVKSCDPKLFAIQGLNLGATVSEKKLKEKIVQSVFNDPHQAGMGILPEYPGVVPLLGLDFRQLELIPVADIATSNEGGKRFNRVASIDSPFREFVAWAFLQICCRPGVPPRNMDPVAAALIACFAASTATDGAK